MRILPIAVVAAAALATGILAWSVPQRIGADGEPGRSVAGLGRDDDDVRLEIGERLASDWIADGDEVGVRVEDGVVTLAGVVDSHQEKLRALELARGIPGVLEVRDEIVVRGAAAGLPEERP